MLKYLIIPAILVGSAAQADNLTNYVNSKFAEVEQGFSLVDKEIRNTRDLAGASAAIGSLTFVPAYGTQVAGAIVADTRTGNPAFAIGLGKSYRNSIYSVRGAFSGNEGYVGLSATFILK